LALHDRWIVSRLNKTARDVRKALADYQFHEAVQTLYHFFWDDFCDWYIELTKSEVTAEEASAERDAARTRLISVLEQALRLLHPFMPYITEDLWQRLPGVGPQFSHPAYREATSTIMPTIMLAAYPEGDEDLISDDVEWEMQALIDLISRVRNIRSEMNIKPGELVPIMIGAPDEKLRSVFSANQNQIRRLVRASGVVVSEKLEAPQASARAVLVGGAEVAVPLEGLIDFEAERARLGKEKEKLLAESSKLVAQLANPQFAERAPAEKVEAIRARIADIEQRTAQLDQTIENLG
jgi:valyl-tRNA synthetase